MPSIFKNTFLLIFLTELLSLFAFLLPDFNSIAFLLILLLILILSIIKLDYGIYAALAELFIGSKGYLFAFSFGNREISIRIGIWLVVLSVWLIGAVVKFIRNRNQKREHLFSFFVKQTFLPYFIILFLFIAWGLVNGFLSHNSFNNIFFDFNGWLYFAYIFPLYSIFKNNPGKQLKIIGNIFLSASLWLSIKTFILLFIFSHNSGALAETIYHWVRDTGVGEITYVQGGFYRVFFQSHIYILIAFFVILLFALVTFKKNTLLNKAFILNFILLIIFLTVNILSYSRSNWIGLVFGLLIFFFFIFKKYGLKKIFDAILVLFFAAVLSLGLLVCIVRFPFPSPTGGFSATSLLSKRATQISGEAGLSSRWSLYPELWQKISSSPALGHGFGTTLTYISSDPRVLEANPEGEYTTYAFEWGWLDIWLKLGIFGLAIYIALIIKIISIGLSESGENQILKNGLAIGLAAVAVVSFFSPYLNHPLGIGYVLLTAMALTSANSKTPPSTKTATWQS